MCKPPSRRAKKKTMICRTINFCVPVLIVGVGCLLANSAGQAATNQQQKSPNASSASEGAPKTAQDTSTVTLSEIQTRSFPSSTRIDANGQPQTSPASSQSPSIPQPAKQLMSSKSEVWSASSGRSGGRSKYPPPMVPEENVPYSPSMYQAPIYKRSEYAMSARGQLPAASGTPPNPPQQSTVQPATRPSPPPQQQQQQQLPSQPISALIAPASQESPPGSGAIQQQQYARPPTPTPPQPSVQIVVTSRDQPHQQQQNQPNQVETRMMPQYANSLPMMRPPPPSPPAPLVVTDNNNNQQQQQQSVPQVIVDVGFPGGIDQQQQQQQIPPQTALYDPRIFSSLSRSTTTVAAPAPPVPTYNQTLDGLVVSLQDKVLSVIDTMITERDVRRRLELQLLINQNEIEKNKQQTAATRNDVHDMRILLNQLEAELQSVHTVPRLAAASIPQESFAVMGQQHVLQPQQQPQQLLGFTGNAQADAAQSQMVANLQAASALQQQLQFAGHQPQPQQLQGPPPFANDLGFGGPQQPQLLPPNHQDPNSFVIQQQQGQPAQQLPLPQQHLQPPQQQQQQPVGLGGNALAFGAAASAVREELLIMINNLTRRVHEQQFMLTELLNGRIPVHSPDPLIRCHFERTANAGILHHNDKRLIVTDVRECLEACVNESTFLCRSVDFQRSSTKHPPGHTECLLSSRDHLTVPEESFNSYIGWDYFYKVCTPV